MLWLNDTREKIKADNPGIKVTEIAKKGGELWKEIKDKSVSIYIPTYLNFQSPFSNNLYLEWIIDKYLYY